MNLPNFHRPDVRIEEASRYAQAVTEARRITGSVFPPHKEAFWGFLAGYDHAAENACEELLDENRSLQETLLFLQVDKGRINALENALDDLMQLTFTHDTDCNCDLCKIVNKFCDRTKS